MSELSPPAHMTLNGSLECSSPRRCPNSCATVKHSGAKPMARTIGSGFGGVSASQTEQAPLSFKAEPTRPFSEGSLAGIASSWSESQGGGLPQ
jgi:hypothetical protein